MPKLKADKMGDICADVFCSNFYKDKKIVSQKPLVKSRIFFTLLTNDFRLKTQDFRLKIQELLKDTTDPEEPSGCISSNILQSWVIFHSLSPFFSRVR